MWFSSHPQLQISFFCCLLHPIVFLFGIYLIQACIYTLSYNNRRIIANAPPDYSGSDVIITTNHPGMARSIPQPLATSWTFYQFLQLSREEDKSLLTACNAEHHGRTSLSPVIITMAGTALRTRTFACEPVPSAAPPMTFPPCWKALRSDETLALRRHISGDAYSGSVDSCLYLGSVHVCSEAGRVLVTWHSHIIHHHQQETGSLLHLHG